jgi:hypothetical protein
LAVESHSPTSICNVKAAIAEEVVLAYPDFLEPFEIYTDASAMQLGAIIIQDKRLIALL